MAANRRWIVVGYLENTSITTEENVTMKDLNVYFIITYLDADGQVHIAAVETATASNQGLTYVGKACAKSE